MGEISNLTAALRPSGCSPLPMPSHCLTRYVKIAPLGYLQPMRPPQSWKYFYTMKWRRHLYIPAISSFIVNKLLHRGALHPYVGQII